MQLDEILDELNRESRERFESENAILTFQEFVELVIRRPYHLTRCAAQYVVDMMDYYGTEEVAGVGERLRRFKVFDDPTGEGEHAAIGQEEVQNQLYRCLNEFVQRRQADKLIMLHGPNGSSKTTLVGAIIRGMEGYSRTEEGTLLRFNWIFSEAADRGERLGFDPVRPEERLASFAHLEPDRVSAKIPCELNDHPIFLIPRERRLQLLREAAAAAGDDAASRLIETSFLVEGDLSPKSRRIHDSLIKAYQGDWSKVMRHVQVERYYISRRFRSGAVTIEPQANVDAQSRQIGHATMNGLPPILQNETLFEALGDLVDANRGIVEYSDFFKRPIEANKYLLTTAENGTINLQSFTACLDLVLMGTSNENYIAAFRREPLFSSFKARLELVRVPYLLQFSKEKTIYDRQLRRLPDAGIAIAPHTTHVAALWAVMTRLMQPSGNVEDDRLRRVLERITPIEKARLYDRAEMPVHLNDEEKNLLRGYIVELRHEYDSLETEFEGMWDVAYEGRRGCSAREMLALLSEASLDPPGATMTPLLVLRYIRQLTKEVTLHQFLRLEPTKNGYHDAVRFIEDVTEEYMGLLRDDVQRAAELVDEGEYGRLFRRYFLNVKAVKTNETVLDESTGRYIEPDKEFMARIENRLNPEEDPDDFRSHLMTKVAATKLGAPDAPIVYEEIFPELFRLLHESFFREKLEKVRRLVEGTLIMQGTLPGSLDHERRDDVERFRNRMLGLGYDEFSLGEALEFFHRRLS